MTGGILVFGIGYNMLHGEQSKVHQPGAGIAAASRKAQLSVAILPLAVPFFAGPGTIATAMNFVADRTPVHIMTTVGSFALICLISYVFFEKLIRYFGDNAVNALTK